MPLPFLDNASCLRALRPWSSLVDALETAMVDFSQGRIRMPVRGVLEVEEKGGFAGETRGRDKNWHCNTLTFT